MLYTKDFYEKLSESIDVLDYSSYTLQYPPPFIGDNCFIEEDFVDSFKKDEFKTSGTGIYIHIPFCETKCTFCRYYSVIDMNQDIHTRYIDAVIKELGLYQKSLQDTHISSLYIGGGTPSAISEYNLERLLEYFFQNFTVNDDFQFCLEANPSSVTYEKMQILAKYKCHRFTLGIQSLDTKVLMKINRKQTTYDVVRALHWAKQVGIDYVNVDMMAGIRGQSLLSFIKDIKFILSLNPDMIHIHPYTATERVIDDKIFVSDEGLTGMMTKIGNTLLEQAGYGAIDGDANGKHVNSRNKQLYDAQSGGSYLGIGVSAIGYNRSYRTINSDSMEQYLQSIENGRFPIKFASYVSKRAKMIQYIIYNMRYGRVLFQNFQSQFNKNMLLEFSDTFDSLMGEGIARIADDGVYFSFSHPREYAIYSKYFYESELLEKFHLNLL